MQAPSGAWITPAFALHRSKLDEILPVRQHAVQPREAQAPPAKARCKAAFFTHVVFDCDGVLVDSERASCESLRRSIRQVTGMRIALSAVLLASRMCKACNEVVCAGVDVPHKFPEDYYPVIGMSVASCIDYYNRACAAGAWDVDVVAAKVLAVKEGHYKELTAQGIEAFKGARALVLEARALGMRVGVGSSGAPCLTWHLGDWSACTAQHTAGMCRDA